MTDALEIEHFVKQNLNRRVLSATVLQPGLGFRKFVRLKLDGHPRSLIARISPRGMESPQFPEPPLEPLRSILEQAGLPVPRSFGARRDGTLDLLEDLGDSTLEAYAHSLAPEPLEDLYTKVLASLPTLQSINLPVSLPAFGRYFDAKLLDFKAQLFTEYVLGKSNSEITRSAFAAIADLLGSAPTRLAHRDFQSQNILIVNAPSGELTPRWIDIQGAFLAPPEYDAVSILHDSYVDLKPELRSKLCRDLRRSLPDQPTQDDFERRFNLITLARKSKDYARFVEAKILRNDDRYLKYLDRTWATIRTASQYCASLDLRLEKLWAHISNLKTGLKK